MRNDPLALEIQRVLEKDLRTGAKLMLPEYRQAALCDNSLDGYCTVGSAAYFFLGDGLEAGLQPMQLTQRHGFRGRLRSSHRWIIRNGVEVIDLTLRPDDDFDYPYESGVARGFMETGYKRPSARAQRLIDLVKAERLKAGRPT